MNYPICKGLEEGCESRVSEYVKARSAAYYQVSTEFAAYKNVEMERARSEVEEHRCVCVCAAKSETMPIPSAVRQFGSAQGLGSKEQGSQIRAIKFARIMGS